MFYNYYHQNNESDYNECTARGACSISPNISSLQEVLLILLRQLSYYIIKLNKFNYDSLKIKNEIIEALSTLVSTTDYSDKLLLNIVNELYTNFTEIKEQYLILCKENNEKPENLKFELKIDKSTSLSNIIAQGERAFLDKYKKMSISQKNLSEVMIFILKSLSRNILKLRDLSEDASDYVNEVINSLNIFNTQKIEISSIKDQIKLLVEADNRLLGRINSAQKNIYGKLQKKEVSHSTSPGKAILVSGTSLDNLHKLLKTAENEDIDIYTHGDLLIAHAMSEFEKFKNLKGHYGDSIENCILDFATFPGAILLTKNFSQNLEFLYRGRLFTTSTIQPQGVIKLDKNDYTKVIESAKSAKGFAKGRIKENEIVGYNEDEINNAIKNIADKFKNKEIQHIFIIGEATFNYNNQEYFKILFKNLPKSTYIISFSYNADLPNFLHINLVNNLPLIYGIIEKLFKEIPIDSDKIAFFLSRCDVSSISNMLGLKFSGAKNIFLTKCPPNAMNPSILKTLVDDYNINITTTPKEDIDKIVK